MVKSNVSAPSRVRAADPFVKQLGHLDVAVVQHSFRRADARSATVSLCPTAGNAASLRSRVQLFDPPELKTAAQLQDAVLVWSRDKVNANYAPRFLHGVPQDLEVIAGNLIADMFRAGAVAGSLYEAPYHVLHDDEGSHRKLEVLEHLMDVGYVHSQNLEENHSTWLLDLQAQCQLQLELASPRPFSQHLKVRLHSLGLAWNTCVTYTWGVAVTISLERRRQGCCFAHKPELSHQ